MRYVVVRLAVAACTLLIIGGAAATPGSARKLVHHGSGALSYRISGADHNLAVSLGVSGVPGTVCFGRLRVRRLSAALPAVRVGTRSGAALWSWLVGRRAPSGRWQAVVTCTRARRVAAHTARALTTRIPIANRTSPAATGRLVQARSMRATAAVTVSQGQVLPTGCQTPPGVDPSLISKDKYSYCGECVWYAWLKRSDLPWFSGASGYAWKWAYAAQHPATWDSKYAGAKKPIPVDTVPAVGTIAVFQPGFDLSGDCVTSACPQAQLKHTYSIGSFGHVAYVEAVDGDTMTISQYNLLDGDEWDGLENIVWKNRNPAKCSIGTDPATDAHACSLQFIYGGRAGAPATGGGGTGGGGTGGGGAVQLGAGDEDTCALLNGGSIDCWGWDGEGELGNGTVNAVANPTPVAVGGITNAAAISASESHACALLAGGKIDCWGWNNYGGLGNGTTADSSTPVPVSGITNATAITGGTPDTCALLSRGAIDCWGANAEGELGNGTMTNSSTPVAVSGITNGITNAIAIGGGLQHSCALLAGGKIECWGDNIGGDLGDGTASGPNLCGLGFYVCSANPVQVSGISNATAITTGGGDTCALLMGGSIDCWGDNNYGQLGNGTVNGVPNPTPVTVSGITNATAISGGDFHACALLAGGKIDCWGENNHGQLGNGTTTDSSTPVVVSGISNATAISAGTYHTCALLAGGSIDCWGFNNVGQLGNGNTTDSTTPVRVGGIA